jgi:hypothetical protein
MKTKRENAEAILNGEQPDYYGDFMDALTIVPDPVMTMRPIPKDGLEHSDSWGVTNIWHVDSPGAHPVARPETLVIKDIENWKDELVVPDLSCLDWSVAQEKAKEVNRHETFLACFSSAGLFERSHHLMGFQNALENYLLYPDEVMELLKVIMEFKIEYIRLIGTYLKPDILFYHDDWGMKTNIFLPPDTWREMIKPLHTQIVAAAHEQGIFFLHHADCYCEPLVLDMVEMGIDAWQGVVAQNNIQAIQQITEGKLAMVGGIDGPSIDTDISTEEDIRTEVRRAIDSYCPAGRFFPSVPNGKLFDLNRNAVYRDELSRYGRQWALKHPK